MTRTGFAYALLPTLTAVLAAGCGTEARTGSQVTLESWRTAACAVLASSGKTEAAPPLPDDDGAFDAFMRREVEAWQKAVADLRAIPLPDERRQEAERLVELNVQSAERYAAALPEIEAASQRWRASLEQIDPDTMESAPEDEAVREAMRELERAQAAARSVSEEREVERLAVELGLSDCGEAP